MKVGDVVRYDRAKGDNFKTPLWARVRSVDDEIVLDIIISTDQWGSPIIKASHERGTDNIDDPTVKRRVVPPEEWPDEVSTEIARRSLLGELSQ